MRCVLGLTVLLFVAAPASAETASSIADLKPGTRILSYLTSRERTSDLNDVGLAFDRRLGLQQGCRTPYRIKGVSLTIVQPIELVDGKEHPSKGAWTQRFEFERCGELKVYNAVFIAKDDAKPEARPYIPGTTNASALLVRDALKTAAGMAQLSLGRSRKDKGLAECKELWVSDTRVSEPARDVVEKGTTYRGVWGEIWEFVGCDAKVAVHVTFVPDGKGGTNFTARAAAATSR